jgi:predicted RNase H-like HicB family nuclease
MSDILKYEVVISWSAEDEAFIARIPDLPGCAADGASQEEALANVQTVAREWIEIAHDLGRPIPHPRGRSILA